MIIKENGLFYFHTQEILLPYELTIWGNMKTLDIAEVFQYEKNSQILKMLYYTIVLPNVE